MKYCCTGFAKHVVEENNVSHAPKVIEQSEDGTWNVNGCCGGGCWVLEKIMYCPYCAKKLSDDPVFTL